MAIKIPVLIHPLTLGNNDKPRYTASDYRKANNVFFPPADGVSGFSCVQGVRATYDGPVCGLNGLSVHIRDHAGYLFPFAGESPYTYYMPDTVFQLDNVTSDWKIAVVVSDSSVGHGSDNSATLTVLPYNTPDASISGLVLATVRSGVLNNTAPRFLTGTTIQVNDFDSLQSIKAIDGQKAHVANDGTNYVRDNGSWVSDDTRYAVKWVSNWTGLPQEDWFLELRTTLKVHGKNGAQGSWYKLDMGARITGEGEYEILSRWTNANTGAWPYQYSLVTPPKSYSGAIDNYIFSNTIFVPNGTYTFEINTIRYREASVAGGAIESTFHNAYLAPNLPNYEFYRYVTLVELC